MNIGNSTAGDMKGTEENFSVAAQSTDGATQAPWWNTKFDQYQGYYKAIPELKSTIDTKSKYVTGKGIIATGEDKEIIDKWRGWGKDTINQIIQNMTRTYYVGGDAFAEIIREKQGVFKKLFTWFGFINPAKPTNLKPLNPGSIGIVVNKTGQIIHYEQNQGVEGMPNKVIKPEDMFHLAKNRFADEIHGTSIITAIENIILARNEALADIKTVFHRYVQPFNVFKLNTDDPDKIAAFVTKENNRDKNKENMFIPMDAVEVERVGMPQFSTLDPLPYIRDLTDYFYQATNTPDVVIGSAKQTVEASAKILILGFEQSVRDDQLFWMENFKAQLGIDIKLEYPTPIEAELVKDEKKDGGKEASEPNDTIVEMEGKK